MMMTITGLVHLFALGMWAGCILVEVLLELMLMRSDQGALDVARYHFFIDLFIEIPLLLVILVSGLSMLQPEHLTGLFLLKILLGLTAIGANGFCAVVVVLRYWAGKRGDVTRVKRLTRSVFASVAAAPAGLAALGIGIHYLNLAG